MIPKRVVLLSGPEDGLDLGDDAMRFRLTYEGPLYSSQPTNCQQTPKQIRLNQHKHAIRKQFHGQLKQLWATDKFLSEAAVRAAEHPIQGIAEASRSQSSFDPNALIPLKDIVAAEFERGDFKFVPLVRESEHLSCALSILFLRRDPPGSIISAGDIDNRLKTLIDGLTMPEQKNQMNDSGPDEGEKPFFCLLQKDNLVTHIDLESDTLLDEPIGEKAEASWVRAIITATVRPYYFTFDNVNYA